MFRVEQITDQRGRIQLQEPPIARFLFHGAAAGWLWQYLIEIRAESWFSQVIVFAELAVGLGMIVGAFVGLAAAGGLTMNVAFPLAESVSANPALAMLAMLLVLAWRNAGYIGVDRHLLPLLCMPRPRRRAAASIRASMRATALLGR